MANVTPEPIFQVANGFMAAKYLFVANEVGFFEKLAERPATLERMTASPDGRWLTPSANGGPLVAISGHQGRTPSRQ